MKKHFISWDTILNKKTIKIYRWSVFSVLILSFLFLLIATSNKREASGEFNVEVVPLVRTAYLQFRLDQLTSPPVELYNPVHMPILQVPETHRASLFWREAGSTAWKEGQPFVHVQKTVVDPYLVNPPSGNNDPRMASMIFGLEEAKSYEYKVEFSGAGYPTTPITGSFTTRSTNKQTKTIADTTIYNDNTNIRGAIQTALSSGSAGKLIEFASRNPQEPAIFKDKILDYYATKKFQGEANNWFKLQGKEGHQIIFDGSDPNYDVVGQDMWEQCDSINNYCGTSVGMTDNMKIYRAKEVFSKMPDHIYYELESGGDSWILQDVSDNAKCGDKDMGLQIVEPWPGRETCENYTWSGLTSIVYRASNFPGDGIFVKENGYVFVHIRNGLDPDSVRMKIPSLETPIALGEARFVEIDNITFQYFAGNQALYYTQSHDLIFKNLIFKGQTSAIGQSSGVDLPKYNITIKNCDFLMRGLNPEYNQANGTWNGTPWRFIKATPEETVAISMKASGVSILDSSIKGVNGGITFGGANAGADYGATATDSPIAWEIDNNYFEGISDDAVEPEVFAIGIATTRNKFEANYKNISLAPTLGGPLYFLRNISVQRGEYPNAYKQAPVKYGNNPSNYGFDTAYKFFANNTFLNATKNSISIGITDGFDQTGPTANLNNFNNFVVSDTVPVNLSDAGASCYPQLFDHNLYMATRFEAGYGSAGVGTFAFVGTCPYYGEPLSTRLAKTFEDWQNGINHPSRPSSINWPTTPPDPTYHSTTMPWIHDPHGKFYSYTSPEAPPDYNLINPVNTLIGDFRPKSDSPNVAMGKDLANITYDVGPGWSDYEEPRGIVTAGAIPAESGDTPIVSLLSSASTYESMSLPIEPIVHHADVFQWSKVDGPDNMLKIDPGDGRSKNITVSEGSITGDSGAYRLKFVATNSTSTISSDDKFVDVHIHKLADIDGERNDNGSFDVDFDDFVLLLSSWGTPINPMANINRSGTSATKVDFDDFVALLSNWGG